VSGTPEWGRVSDPPPTAGSCQLGASWRGVAWIHAVGNGVGVECLIAVPRIRLGSSDNEGSTPDKVTPLRAWGPLAVTSSRPLLLISRSENLARRIQADHRPDGLRSIAHRDGRVAVAVAVARDGPTGER
jgi:hypothetical protein